MTRDDIPPGYIYDTSGYVLTYKSRAVLFLGAINEQGKPL